MAHGANPSPLALVQDHIVQRGGAERVLLSMATALPGAPIHTSFYRPEATYREFEALDIRTSPLDRLGPLRRHHRAALPVMAPAFSRMRIAADVTICCTSGWAQGARVVVGRKLVYVHAIARWLHQPEAYLAGHHRAARAGLRASRAALTRWDRRTMATADRHLVHGSAMRAAVRRHYGVDAELLPPPVTIDPEGAREPLDGVEPGFALCASRLMPYKNVDAVVDAVEGLPSLQLVVAGDGPESGRLRARAPANVVFAGEANDARLRWLYANCAFLVAAAHEPYGLTPLEAAAFGKPSVVLGAGGYLDTVRPDETGLYFDEPEPTVIGAAMREVNRCRFDAATLTAHAARWSEAAFIDRLRAIVDEEGALA